MTTRRIRECDGVPALSAGADSRSDEASLMTHICVMSDPYTRISKDRRTARNRFLCSNCTEDSSENAGHIRGTILPDPQTGAHPEGSSGSARPGQEKGV